MNKRKFNDLFFNFINKGIISIIFYEKIFQTP